MRRPVKWIVGAIVVLGLAATGIFAWFVYRPVHNIPALEPVNEYVWLDQG